MITALTLCVVGMVLSTAGYFAGGKDFNDSSGHVYVSGGTDSARKNLEVMEKQQINAFTKLNVDFNLIKRDIVTGKRELGEKLPSVRELAVSYTINPNTVSRVYKELETEGVCFTRRGMGTFVTEDSEKVKNMKEEMAGTLIHEFLEGMQQLGFTKTDVIWILKKKEESGE